MYTTTPELYTYDLPLALPDDLPIPVQHYRRGVGGRERGLSSRLHGDAEGDREPDGAPYRPAQRYRAGADRRSRQQRLAGEGPDRRDRRRDRGAGSDGQCAGDRSRNRHAALLAGRDLRPLLRDPKSNRLNSSQQWHYSKP